MHSWYFVDRINSSHTETNFRSENEMTGNQFKSRRSYPYPTNHLCGRSLARATQYFLLGKLSDSLESSVIADSFNDHIYNEDNTFHDDDVFLSNGRWHTWWTGERLPNKKFTSAIDHISPNMGSMWVTRDSISHCLPRHFGTLDFRWIKNNISIDKARQEASEVLEIINILWKPDFFGNVSYFHADKTNFKDWSFPKASASSRKFYKTGTPDSICDFLLAYAIELYEKHAIIKEEIIFDLLSSIIATYTLLEDDIGLTIFEQPHVVALYDRSLNFFWDDDIRDGLLINTPIGRFIKYLDYRGIPHDVDKAPAFFQLLKQRYYEALSITGYKEDELLPLIRGYLSPGTNLGQ